MEKGSLSVSALVPAYNEEKNIGQIISILKKSHLIDEIVCINDGSTDKSLQIIQSIPNPKIQVINLKKNAGKANAIVKGLKKAKGEIVVFIDADVIGFKNDSIKKLITPLKKGCADAVIGYPVHNKMDKFFKPLAGERAYFRKDLLPYLPTLKNKRWGLELHLNYLYRQKRVKITPLQIKNTMKHHKYSYDLAAKIFFIESFDLLLEILKQKRPINYLKDSYIYPFYRERQLTKTRQNPGKLIIQYSLKIYNRLT